MTVVAIVPTGARVATFTTNGGFSALRLECANRPPIQIGLQAELLFDFYDLLQKALEAHSFVATALVDMSSETREQSQRAFLSEAIPMVTKSGYAIKPDQMTWLPHFKDGGALLIQLLPPIVRLIFDQIDFAVKNKVLIDLRPFIGKSWQEMNRAFMQLPVLAIDDRLRAFDFSLELFRRHSRALIQHLESLSGSLTLEQVSWRRRHAIDFGIKEAMFRLFDFLSADDALVNHSRVYYEKFYGSVGQIPTYREEVAKRFKNNGLSKFFDDLRNLMMHKGPIGPSHKLFPMRLEGRYQLDRDLLLSSYSKWSMPARQFLNDSPKEVDLLELVQSRVEIKSILGSTANVRPFTGEISTKPSCCVVPCSRVGASPICSPYCTWQESQT